MNISTHNACMEMKNGFQLCCCFIISAARITSSTISNPAEETESVQSQLDSPSVTDSMSDSADQLMGMEIPRAVFKWVASTRMLEIATSHALAAVSVSFVSFTYTIGTTINLTQQEGTANLVLRIPSRALDEACGLK